MLDKREKLRKLLEFKSERHANLVLCKNVLKTLSFEGVTSWSDQLDEEQLLLILSELYVDKDYSREFKIIEGYYLNRYTD